MSYEYNKGPESVSETMILLHDLRQSGDEGQLPQVVGLTASLGVGNSDTKQLAVDHVIRMAANMAADVVSTVYRESSSLEEHVFTPKDGWTPLQYKIKMYPLSWTCTCMQDTKVKVLLMGVALVYMVRLMRSS